MSVHPHHERRGEAVEGILLGQVNEHHGSDERHALAVSKLLVNGRVPPQQPSQRCLPRAVGRLEQDVLRKRAVNVLLDVVQRQRWQRCSRQARQVRVLLAVPPRLRQLQPRRPTDRVWDPFPYPPLQLLLPCCHHPVPRLKHLGPLQRPLSFLLLTGRGHRRTPPAPPDSANAAPLVLQKETIAIQWGVCGGTCRRSTGSRRRRNSRHLIPVPVPVPVPVSLWPSGIILILFSFFSHTFLLGCGCFLISRQF